MEVLIELMPASLVRGGLVPTALSDLMALSPLSRRSSKSCAGVCPSASMTSEVVENEFEFYSKAEKYWKDVPATVDGMLGGYGHISSIDINSSRKFLQRFLRDGPNRTGTTRALDCGAGIGRITKRLLLPLFKTVDMVDVTEDFLTKAKSYLGDEGRRDTSPTTTSPTS
ncbi:N-terminal Xaa-Pro-Lys N-methyltransferase 1 isoform X4 [Grus americana]|uniref:N-terminal Xaa-Pro-Lys N-methyltransferase 1 isoform X4 n=1 Tax=Grus americana TaxID=9117 RepID=UPI0024080850|nr:N-terminal Xaa-Pro-Lys N-methyltransferase 1 isoform X4 [Grus americana]